MCELQSLSPDLLIHIARTLQVSMKGLVATVELLDEGATVPFIARYRKEATGNFDEVQIRAIEERLLYLRELVSRKETILASIQEQGKLTDELKGRIDRTLDKGELEDLYLPFKPKRRTKAQIARENGLQPLADLLLADPTRDPQAAATGYLGESVPDAAAPARAGARLPHRRRGSAPGTAGRMRRDHHRPAEGLPAGGIT